MEVSPGQSIWDLWSKKWCWDRLLSETFGFPVSITFSPLLHIHSCITWGMGNMPVSGHTSTETQSHRPLPSTKRPLPATSFKIRHYHTKSMQMEKLSIKEAQWVSQPVLPPASNQILVVQPTANYFTD
jgi:hypothetical protein